MIQHFYARFYSFLCTRLTTLGFHRLDDLCALRELVFGLTAAIFWFKGISFFFLVAHAKVVKIYLQHQSNLFKVILNYDNMCIYIIHTNFIILLLSEQLMWNCCCSKLTAKVPRVLKRGHKSSKGFDRSWVLHFHHGNNNLLS